MNQYAYEIEHRIANLYQYRQNRVIPDNPHVITAGRILALRTYRSILFFYQLSRNAPFFRTGL